MQDNKSVGFEGNVEGKELLLRSSLHSITMFLQDQSCDGGGINLKEDPLKCSINLLKQ